MRFARTSIGEVNWRTITRELVITTVGVLVALALNSWWGERQNRAREHAYLTQLTADIDRSLLPSNLPRAVREETEASRATVQLLRAYRSAAPVSPDSVAHWLFQAQTFVSYTPLTGTARALLSTGDINLIRNDSLRITIPAIVATVDDYSLHMHDYELRWRAQSAELERFTDYIALRSRMLGAYATDSLARVDSTFEIPPAPRREPFPSTDYSALLQNHDAYRALIKMNTAHKNTLDILRHELDGLRSVRDEFAAAR